MEPQLPTPHGSPENRGPAHFSGGEVYSGVPTPEAAQPKTEQKEVHETKEQHTGGPQGDPAAAVAPALPSLPQLTPVQTKQDDQTTDDTNPTAAADEDLIEKEWVEKAKKVVAETKHDPYMQEQAVSKLQADYIKKRYGKTVNLPSDEQG